MQVFIHMPFYSGGDMNAWLPKHAPTTEKLREVFYQVLDGIAYLHSENILHCDIKLENILMTEDSLNARPIISDFDISKDNEQRSMITTQSGTTTAVVGTLAYMSPEIQPREMGGLAARQTEASDMFAFGVVCFNALFPGRYAELKATNPGSPSGMKQSDTGLASPFTIPPGAPPELTELLSGLLAHEPKQRPAAAALLEHPYLQPESLLREAQAERQQILDEKDAFEEKIEAERQASRQTAAEEAAALMRTCQICFDEVSVTVGIECQGAQKHFTCSDCFSGHVTTESSADPDLLQKRKACVSCPLGRGDLGCDAPSFTDAEVAQCATEEAFSEYSGAKIKLMEQALSREIEATERARFNAEIERLQRMSEEQREVHMARIQIESMLNLKCPRCKAVFLDFNGCMALNCSAAGCGCGFCAWCLQDCGQDAHQHVANECRSKPAGQDRFFGDMGAWKQVHAQRVKREVEEFLNPMKAEVREQVLAVCEQQLVDVGLHDMVPRQAGGIELDAAFAMQLQFEE